MTEALDLTPYCSTDPLRPYLHAPFTQGGHTFATNGYILVRVTLRPDVLPPPENKPRADKLFARDWREPTMPLPAFTLPEERLRECENCKGEKHNFHACECCECTCEACDDEGRVSSLNTVSVGLCGAFFAAKYARMLQPLPGIRVAPSKDAMSPMPFAFDGGEGLLMPLRTTLANHIDVPAITPATP